MRTIIRWAPAVLLMGVIFALSSQSALPPPPGISATIAAVIGHLVIYFALACLLAFAIAPDWRLTRTRAIVVLAICVLYGISDEIHQSFVEGRTASLFDVIVDGLGALLGVTVSSHVLGWLVKWRAE